MQSVNEFKFNIGTNATYDQATGLYSNFGPGVYEYRVGDEVENARTGQRFVISKLNPRDDSGEIRFGSPCIVWVNDNKQNCCVQVLKPVNPDRMYFGWVVTTKMVHEGKPIGSAQRFITLAEANAEIDRLMSVKFPGTIALIDRD